MRIAEVIPKDDCVLYIESVDGRTGWFDVKPYLKSEIFSPLQDRREFERVHNGGYYIEWACGADLSADTVEARWKLAQRQDVQPDHPAEAPRSRG